MSDKVDKMIDIMSERRNTSDLCWILKDYESKIGYFSNYKSSVFVKKHLLDSIQFKYELKLLSDKEGKQEEQLVHEALEILNGMSHNIGMNSIRFMGFTLSKVIKQIYDKVYVNASQMEQLRNAFTRSNVILLPTHRSYADFLLMSYVMFEHNLPLPVIAAAMDFMDMRLVGELLRSCGAFFIRRSFASDELYWNVFSHYIKTLIQLAQEPLEFFIEGTRSRTNKSLFPRIGLLGIVLECWLSKSPAEDIELVPISISYDRILEERLYAWELLGIPKPKESTSGLLKVRHILNDNYGSIYLNVGEPISIKQLATQFCVSRCHHNLQLRWRPRLFDKEKQLLRYLGHLIVAKQQQSLLICDWSIVALVLVFCQYSLSEQRLVELFNAIIQLLTSWGVLLAADSIGQQVPLEGRVQACLRLHEDLWRNRDGLIDTHYDIGERIGVEDASIVASIQLGNARNPLLFHLARESVLLSMIRNGGWQLELSFDAIDMDLCRDFNRLIRLLGREFVYALPFDGDGQNGGEVSTQILRQTAERLTTCGLLTESAEPCWLRVNTEHACLDIVEGAVHTHLLAYAICAHLLVAKDTTIGQLPTAQQCKFIQNVIKQLCYTNPEFGVARMEMCSLDMIRNAVSSLIGIMKCAPAAEIQQLIGIIGRSLPSAIRCQLPADYPFRCSPEQ